MPRKYIGSFDRVSVQHPVSGVMVEAGRNEPITELDDAGDLGPDWVDAAPAPAPKPAPAKAEKEGD